MENALLTLWCRIITHFAWVITALFGALKVKCAQDIFKHQGPVNLKVTFTVMAESS